MLIILVILATNAYGALQTNHEGLWGCAPTPATPLVTGLSYICVYQFVLLGNEYIERFFWHEAFPESNKDDCIALSYQSDTTEFTWNPRSPDNNNGVLCQYGK